VRVRRLKALWQSRWLGPALLLLALALLAPYVAGGGSELVRVRHALALGPDLPADPEVATDWRPPVAPPGFKADAAGPDPFFVEVAARIGVAAAADDWQRALVISRHLLGSAAVLNGGALQRDLRRTYRAIVERGDGYCGDFVRVFSAIAAGAGMTTRPWAFSFDGFGGHGHIWLEVWNRDAAVWQLVDIFNNGYFVLDGRGPLSAAQVLRALRSRAPGLAFKPLHEAARPGFVIEAKAWDYFGRGARQWFALWGNNVFATDSGWAAALPGGLERVVGTLATLLGGDFPEVRMVATADNEAERNAMRRLRLRLGLAVGAAVLGLALSALRWWPARRPPTPALQDGGWPRVCIVGPLPPPSGGMANQCEQLVRLLRSEGLEVDLVRSNAPYRPGWVGRVPFVRAAFRLVPYLAALWRAFGRADVMHLFANSGWAWHLVAAPALALARMRAVPVIVNYRGGQAGEFLASAPGHVVRALRSAALLVTPSTFLQGVFAQHRLHTEIIPNVVDLNRFAARPARAFGAAPHVIVTRNLESIYDIPTALRAFAALRRQFPEARLTVAGSGPERAALEAEAAALGLGASARFAGRIDNADIAALYASADLMLNPSTADNMPISILEALAAGVPVVSTDAGGIPHLVRHELSALLVPVGDAPAMAAAAQRLLSDAPLAERLRQQGQREAARYAWPAVRAQWLETYARVARRATATPQMAR
jgi:glycosyltransferase involved in cell wall biosynthesis